MRPFRPIIVVSATVAVIICVVAAVTIAGCRRKAAPLPAGIQTISGILERADISLTRRGTDRLLVNGMPLYFAESSVVNLRSDEGVQATFQGTFEPNTDPADLPVLVVTRVIGGATAPTRMWTIPVLHLSLNVPADENGVITGSMATFTASGSVHPLLLINEASVAALPFDFRAIRNLSGGTLSLSPVVIAARKAVTVRDDPKHLFAVYVEETSPPSPGAPVPAKKVIGFTFPLDPSLDAGPQTDAAMRIVQSIQFASASSSSSHRPMTTGTGSSAMGQPCGGAAGILCPSGSYCAITDRQNDIGVCTVL